MAIAVVLKISQSGKSALLGIKKSAFHFLPSELVYTPNKGYELKQEFQIPDDMATKPWTNPDGTVRQTQAGLPLKVFA